MSLILAYNKYQNNWYPGELYDSFAKYLLSQYDNIRITSLNDLATKIQEPIDLNHSYSSIFNIYNLIVYNIDKKQGYLHSFADPPGAFIHHKSAFYKLNIKTVSFCSSLTPSVLQDYLKLNIKVIPSFYILENFDDHNHIQNNKYKNQKYNRCYFNGLSYGHRKLYINCLKNSNYFIMKEKNNIADYKSKKEYFDEVSNYKFGLSLNGAAQICYRDMEYFGLGILCIREPLNILTKDQITKNIHYKSFLDNNVSQDIYDENKHKDVAKYLEEQIKSITLEEYNFITDQAHKWFNNNVKIVSQIEFIKKNLIENNIL